MSAQKTFAKGDKVVNIEIDFGVFVGARYYFTEQLATMAELGYDISVFKIRIAYKF